MSKSDAKYTVTLTDVTKKNMEDDVVGFVKGKVLIKPFNFKEILILLLNISLNLYFSITLVLCYIVPVMFSS